MSLRNFFIVGLGLVFGMLSYTFASCEERAACLSSCGPDSPCSDCEITYACDCGPGSCSSCSDDSSKESCKKDECLSTNPGQDDFCTCISQGGIKLNTSVPFIGRCILLGSEDAQGADSTQVTQLSAFPRLMKALTNIMLSLILVTSLIMVIAGGVMIASSGANSGGYEQGKKMIKKVVIGLILLGASGIILALINPNFFG